MIKFRCCYCEKPLTAPDKAIGKTAPCPSCGRVLELRAVDNQPILDAEPEKPIVYQETKRHSALGIASFLIALVVGGIEALLFMVVLTALSNSHGTSRYNQTVADGGVILGCYNLIAIPLCLVGVGLAIVSLAVNRKQNPIFADIGLGGNGMILLLIIGVIALGVLR